MHPCEGSFSFVSITIYNENNFIWSPHFATIILHPLIILNTIHYPLFITFFLLIFFNGFLDVFHMRNQMAFVQQLEAVGMWWFSSIFFFSFHVLLLINGFLDVFHMRNQMAFVQKLEVVGMWWFSSIFFFFSF